MKVRALIGPMSSAAGRQGIARLLAAAPRGYRTAVAADQCETWEDVLARLSAEPFDVLIAEFGDGSPAIDRLFELQPKLSVIEVDLAGGTTNVHVFDVGSETLVRLAEWLSREAGLTGANDTIARITHARPQLSVAADQPGDRPDAMTVPEPQPQPAGDTKDGLHWRLEGPDAQGRVVLTWRGPGPPHDLDLGSKEAVAAVYSEWLRGLDRR